MSWLSLSIVLIENITSTLNFASTTSTRLNFENNAQVTAWLADKNEYIVQECSFRYAPKLSPTTPGNAWARLRLTYPGVSTPDVTAVDTIADFPFSLKWISNCMSLSYSTIIGKKFRKSTGTGMTALFPSISYILQTEGFAMEMIGSLILDLRLSPVIVIGGGTGGGDNVPRNLRNDFISLSVDPLLFSGSELYYHDHTLPEFTIAARTISNQTFNMDDNIPVNFIRNYRYYRIVSGSVYFSQSRPIQTTWLAIVQTPSGFSGSAHDLMYSENSLACGWGNEITLNAPVDPRVLFRVRDLTLNQPMTFTYGFGSHLGNKRFKIRLKLVYEFSNSRNFSSSGSDNDNVPRSEIVSECSNPLDCELHFH